MPEKTFQSSEIINIFKELGRVKDLDQRQIIHWTERQLIIPLKEAKGAGSRREYSYNNLLEFGLAKELYDMGLETYQIKIFLDDVRYKCTFDRLKNISEELKNIIYILEHSNNENIQYKAKEKVKIDPRVKVEFLAGMKEVLNSKEPKGILVFSLKGNKVYIDTFPYTIDYFYKNFNIYIKEPHRTNKSVIIINIGQIKKEIDGKIKKIYS